MRIFLAWICFFCSLNVWASTYSTYPYGDYHWQPPVVSVAALPTNGNNPADARITMDTFSVYIWNGSAWVLSSGGGGGGVTSVTASAPLASSGGSTPNITCQVASGSLSGCLSASDWATFNGKQNALSFGNLTDSGTDGIAVTNGSGAVVGSGTSLSQHVADSLHNGYLTFTDWIAFNAKQAALTFGAISTSTSGVTVGNGSASTVGPNVTVDVQTASASQPGLLSSSDWTIFNAKQSALTFGNLTDAGTDGITVTSGAGAVIGSGTSLSQQVSDASHNGYLASSDWNTFNNKAPINSPAFTGVPTAPTASLGTSTTQLATTAFVLSQGFQGATGSMPNASSTTLATTTSATTTFVNAITTPITVTASSAPILAKCVLDMTSATAASVATVRVTINGVSGGSVTESLTTATTQHLTVPNQNLSAALGPGTYTVNCDFNRASGTGTVTVGQGSLTAVALQGTESNGISQLAGLGLAAGPGSGLQSITGILTMAGGGTGANLTAANGAIPYSGASVMALLAPGTLGQLFRSGGAGAPTWTSETFPASTTINQILYSSAANVVSGLATANTGALVTSSTGVPSIASGSTANRLLRTNGTTVSFAQAALATDVSGTLPMGNGGTGLTSLPNQRIPYGTGAALQTDPLFLYDTTNTRFNVGGTGTATINAIVSSGSHTALQAYNSSAGNAFQATNVTAYSAALINRFAGSTSGASIGLEFGRGTPASPGQVLNGDQIGVIAATPDASDGVAHGYSGAISFVASEDTLTTATGGDLVMSVTPNGGNLVPVERIRIKNSGETTLVNSHLKSTQTSPPTATVQANAGTGATCSISAGATDIKGQINVTTGTIGISTGSYCQLGFVVAYGAAPICALTPAGSTLSTSAYVTSSTTTMDVNFAVAGGITSSYLVNYHCIE